MSFYEKIKTTANAANSENLDNSEGADVFRDGLFIGNFDLKLEPILPVIVPLKLFGSICILDDGSNTERVVNFMQACACRILLSLDSSLCNFILYDKVGLGNGFISLSGLDSRIKGERILTTNDELNRALEKLSDRAVSVIQNVLGSKYANSTLIDYNREADNRKEPYYFLLIKDYPEGVSNEQCAIIKQIVESGPKAGIFTLLSYSPNNYSEKTFNRSAKDILNHTCNIVHFEKDAFVWHNVPNKKVYNFAPFKLATKLPSPESLSKLFARITDHLNQAENITLDIMSEMKEQNFWKSDASSGIQVPIGMQNASTMQYFHLGDSTNVHHVLIGGSTGYGKSVLLHNIICNTAWRYSPEQLQMILLDYKEGTEFKVYDNLPHARVLSIQSEREYGCSVFNFIAEEIHRRGDVFRAAGTQDITSYNHCSGKTMPRILIIIDEFQKLLDGDARTTDFISSALEDVGRRGRSFGINLILSTQSLMNVNIGGVQQSLGLRIVLHLNTQYDCERFLTNGNYLPYTALTRPGQAVYNANAGLTEGNVLFQTAYMAPASLSKVVGTISDHALLQYDGELAPYKRFFYDGSSLVEIESNKELSNFREPNERFCNIFIGEPVALTESHASFKLRRQSGSNVLMVGGDEASVISILSFSVLQILNQSWEDCRIVIADKTNTDSKYYDELRNSFSPFALQVSVCEWDEDIADHIDAIHAEMLRRIQNRQPRARIVLMLNNLYEIRPLRRNGYTKPEYNQKLTDIIKEGPHVGIHAFVHALSYHSLTQIFDAHEMLSEFEVKIELSKGDGSQIFGAAYTNDRLQLPDDAEYMAKMQIGDTGKIVKLRVYKNKFDKTE